jgi:hypothetical protein
MCWCENPFSHPVRRESLPASASEFQNRWCENPFSHPLRRESLPASASEFQIVQRHAHLALPGPGWCWCENPFSHPLRRESLPASASEFQNIQRHAHLALPGVLVRESLLAPRPAGIPSRVCIRIPKPLVRESLLAPRPAGIPSRVCFRIPNRPAACTPRAARAGMVLVRESLLAPLPASRRGACEPGSHAGTAASAHRGEIIAVRHSREGIPAGMRARTDSRTSTFSHEHRATRGASAAYAPVARPNGLAKLPDPRSDRKPLTRLTRAPDLRNRWRRIGRLDNPPGGP